MKRTRERIAASVLIDGNGCWMWQKKCQKNGYGVFALGGGKTALAHRVSYSEFIGEIPSNLIVCHKCDVRPCVNPDHLFIGTHSDNIIDAYSKNRMRLNPSRGEDNPRSKLKNEDVVVIINRLQAGEAKASIARSFGVTDRVILLIHRNEIWQHIERPA